MLLLPNNNQPRKWGSLQGAPEVPLEQEEALEDAEEQEQANEEEEEEAGGLREVSGGR